MNEEDLKYLLQPLPSEDEEELNKILDEYDIDYENYPNAPYSNKKERLTKEEFDMVVKSFIEKKGSIRKVDFSRAYNNLPSVWYVREYYGTLGNLQKAFGVEDLSNSWNRII